MRVMCCGSSAGAYQRGFDRPVDRSVRSNGADFIDLLWYGCVGCLCGETRHHLEKPRKLVLPDRIELSTSPLPMECSTTELRQRNARNAKNARQCVNQVKACKG